MNTRIKRPVPACVGAPDEVFFPDHTLPRAVRRRALERAQAFCAGCPLRRQCAEFAAPLVESRDLVDCVVAGVLVPIYHTNTSYTARRREAAEQLRAIAAGDDSVSNELMEGAA